MIEIKDLTVKYTSVKEEYTALEDIDLVVPTGGTCALIGPSGCGKSTLLKVMAGIIKDYRGTVEFDGAQLKPAQQKIGFIPQNYGLLPWRNVIQNICVAARLKQDKAITDDALAKIIRLLGLEGLNKRYPGELSGGQQQRVSLARAFLLKPDVLLMDEPFSALDAITREEMQDVFLSLWNKYAVSTVLVTHYVEEAIYLGQKIVILSANPGRVAKVIDNPLFGETDIRHRKKFFDMSLELRDLLKQGGNKA
jgi:ABC-type nitrate/sulfonate/bicarbonate transport system ATPase subunit